MFGNSLQNLGKSTGECKNHFWKFSEIFGNLRQSSEKIAKCGKVLKTTCQYLLFFKSLEIIGSLRISSENFGTFQHFRNFYEIFENCRKSSERIGKCRKVLKTIFWHFLKIFKNFQKSSEVFGNARKTSETCGKCLFRKIFYNIPISDTCGLKIRFKNFDLQFALVLRFLHWYYTFCTGVTL